MKVPETTEDMIEMITYIDQVKTKGIEELNNNIMVGTSELFPFKWSVNNNLNGNFFYNTFSRKHNTR